MVLFFVNRNKLDIIPLIKYLNMIMELKMIPPIIGFEILARNGIKIKNPYEPKKKKKKLNVFKRIYLKIINKIKGVKNAKS